MVNVNLVVEYISARIVIPGNFVICVVLPSMDRIKSFNAILHQKLDEIPAWLRPVQTVRQLKQIEFSNFKKIILVCNQTNLKGQSVDALYYSSDIADIDKTALILCTIPLGVSKGNFIEFTD